MPLSIPNTTVSSQSYTAALQFGFFDVFAYGYFTVANNPVFVQMLLGERGQAHPGPELYLPPGTYPLQAGTRQPIAGIRFRAASAATPAPQVFGTIFYAGEASVQAGNPYSSTISPSGGVTPGQLSLTVQHNGVVVAAEPVLDFEDASGFVWTVADDAPNTRIQVTAPTLFTPVDVLRKITSTDVNTTTTETDLLGGACTIPAGALGTNRAFFLEMAGDFLNSGAGAATPRLVARFGGVVGPPPTGTILVDTGTSGAATVTAATRVGWKLRLVMYASAAAVQYADFDFEMPGVTPSASVGAAFSTGLGWYNLMLANSFLIAKAKGVSNGTIAVDSSVAQLFTVGVINGAALGTYSMRCNRARAFVL